MYSPAQVHAISNHHPNLLFLLFLLFILFFSSLSLGQAEAMLEKVIVIFRYLQDKDVFENFYKTHLSKRLLGGRSVSDEVTLTSCLAEPFHHLKKSTFLVLASHVRYVVLGTVYVVQYSPFHHEKSATVKSLAVLIHAMVCRKAFSRCFFFSVLQFGFAHTYLVHTSWYVGKHFHHKNCVDVQSLGVYMHISWSIFAMFFCSFYITI